MRGAVGWVAIAVIAVLAAGAWFVTRDEPLPTEEARAFAEAWEAYDEPRLLKLSTDPAIAEALAAFKKSARIASTEVVVRDVVRRGDHAVATIDATHVVAGLGEWDMTSEANLVDVDGAWKVDWSPAILHPQMADGDSFEVERSWPERAHILADSDQPLTSIGQVVAVGVQPSRIADRAAVASALQQHVGVEPARLDSAVDAPGVQPDHFVPLINLREERYQSVRPALLPVPGVVFRRVPARITPAEGFAAHTIGRVGPITAEQLEELGAPYTATDEVGRYGLEAAFEEQLAGSPSGELRLVKASGEKVVVKTYEGRAPSSVRTTLREAVQRAADAALAGVIVPAALVAVDASTGGIVAVSSRPLEEPLNRALNGRYPPGSTFKIVTAAALVPAASEAVSCPTEVTVGGKRFKNFEGEALGDTTLRTAFANSCNTVFAPAAAALDDGVLRSTAERFGFNVEYSVVRTPAVGGEFPDPRDDAEAGAAGIGQGRVIATPVHMASVAAAAVTGTWRAPHLLAGQGEGGSTPTATIDATTAASLNDFMAAVVSEGTGRAAASVSGLVGKTGTAEFGADVPPRTHAWFVGHRNGVAFAVVLEGGGVGGRDAAPIAARFAAAL